MYKIGYIKTGAFIVPIFSAFILSYPAYADTENKRFYIDMVYILNVASDVYTDNTDFSNDGGLAGFIGYNTLPWLTVEVGGIVLDTMSIRQNTDLFVHRGKYELSGYTLGLKGITSYEDLFDIWIAVGMYSWKSKYDYEVEYPGFPTTRNTGSDTNSSEDAYFRVGVTLPLTYGVSATLESSYLELDNLFHEENGGKIDFDHRYIGIGLEYSF